MGVRNGIGGEAEPADLDDLLAAGGEDFDVSQLAILNCDLLELEPERLAGPGFRFAARGLQERIDVAGAISVLEELNLRRFEGRFRDSDVPSQDRPEAVAAVNLLGG